MRITIVSLLAALLAACGAPSTDSSSSTEDKREATTETAMSETDRLNAWFEE